MDLLWLLLVLLGIAIGVLVTHLYWSKKIPELRQDAVQRSRSTLGGQFAEQLAPYFPDFPYSPTELRWLGKPIDYVVFKGMDRDAVEEIIFLEVKSGKSQLNDHQRQIRQVVEKRKVTWDSYRVS